MTAKELARHIEDSIVKTLGGTRIALDESVEGTVNIIFGFNGTSVLVSVMDESGDEPEQEDTSP